MGFSLPLPTLKKSDPPYEWVTLCEWGVCSLLSFCLSVVFFCLKVWTLRKLLNFFNCSQLATIFLRFSFLHDEYFIQFCYWVLWGNTKYQNHWNKKRESVEIVFFFFGKFVLYKVIIFCCLNFACFFFLHWNTIFLLFFFLQKKNNLRIFVQCWKEKNVFLFLSTRFPKF